jgi:hypothetical protein
VVTSIPIPLAVIFFVPEGTIYWLGIDFTVTETLLRPS